MSSNSPQKLGHGWIAWSCTICGLLAFAVAQPLFGLLLDHPTFLHVHRVGWLSLGALMLLLFLPGVLWAGALALLARWRERLARWLFAASAGGLLAGTLLPILHRLLADEAALALALLAGLLSSIAIDRFAGFRRSLVVTVFAAAIFPVVFLVQFASQYAHESASGHSPARSTGKHSLFLIVMDEVPLTNLLLSYDAIDSLRYPNFARLASESVWYRNAYTANAYSEKSVPILLTGRRPKAKQRPTLADHDPNLFTLLQDSYEIVAKETLTRLCPTKVADESRQPSHDAGVFLADCAVLWLHQLLPSSLTGSLPRIDQRWSDFLQLRSHREQPERHFRAWLDRLRAGDRPTFGFLHMVYPHNPYIRFPDGRRYSDRSDEPFLNLTHWVDDDWATLQALYRSRLQLQHFDALLGEFMARLQSIGMYENSVIALVADHGACFRPGQSFRVTAADNLMDLLPIPVFLKLPNGARGGTIDRRWVSSLDLLPTILEAAQIHGPWRMHGHSLLDSTAAERTFAEILQPAAADTTLEVSFSELARQRETLERIQTSLSPERSFSFGRHVELIGRAVFELAEGEPSELEVFVANAAALSPADRGDDWVGGELRGSLEGQQALAAPRDLAIAVADTIVATTRSVPASQNLRAWGWVALLPPAATAQSARRPQFFEIAEGATLRALTWREGSPSYLDRRLGLGTTSQLALSGFYPEFSDRGELRRWTNGQGRLRVPIRLSEPPRRLRMELASSSPKGSRLQIYVEGRELLDRSIDPGAWSGVVDLPEQPIDENLDIEIRSDRFVPAKSIRGSNDERVLGVLVRGIWLLSDTEVSEPPK